MRDELRKILTEWDLLKHPFYQAWNDGMLSQEALGVYATEYGSFIRLLEQGWLALGDPSTAEEEREHAGLWDEFTRAVAAQVGQAALVVTQALTATAQELFSDRPAAMGAMYAFEAQQPATAESKHAGLRAHYALPEAAHRYFDVHRANSEEAERLLSWMESLSTNEQLAALRGCRLMAEALWNALTGIHESAKLN